MSKFIDLTGQRFGRLIVIERVVDKERENKQHTTFWKCICDCEGQIVCSRNHLLDGHIRSCGCLHDENAKKVIGFMGYIIHELMLFGKI